MYPLLIYTIKTEKYFFAELFVKIKINNYFEKLILSLLISIFILSPLTNS